MPKYTVMISYRFDLAAGESFYACVQAIENVWHPREGIHQPGIGTDPTRSRITFQSVVTANREQDAVQTVQDASAQVCRDIATTLGHVADPASVQVTVAQWTNPYSREPTTA